VSTPAPAGGTVAIPAVDDTYIDANSTASNFGNGATLMVDGSPVRRALLRFGVPAMPSGAQITSAKLRMYVTDSASNPGSVYRVNGGWAEGTVTAKNAPALGDVIATLPAASSGQWLEVDVTSAVASGNVEFYLASSGTNGVDFASSESANKPQLVVTTSGGTIEVPSFPSSPGAGISTPTPTPTPVLTPTPTPTATATPKPGCPTIPAVNLSILSERSGFGADVDGGADGCLYVVTNDKDSGPGSLREGASQGDRWIVCADDFNIRLNSRVEIASNTPIAGRGHQVTISGGTLRLTGKGKQNLILHNLSLRDSVAGDDLIRIGDGASHFWLHHLTLSNSTDEYIDITRAGSGGLQGTISWSRFNPGTTNTDEFAIIVGDMGGEATNHLINVTFHHNWYNKTRQRHPLITGAYVHSYNNYVQWRLWGIHAREGTQLVSEHDVFDAAYAPSNNDDDAVKVEGTGNFVRVVNPILLNNASVQTENPDKAFKPSSRYSYSLDPASSVIASVTAGAGNTR
jgi:pectate lyase